MKDLEQTLSTSEVKSLVCKFEARKLKGPLHAYLIGWFLCFMAYQPLKVI